MASFGAYESSAWHRFLRAVSRTFSLGTWFGVEVHMFWAAAVLVPLLFLRWIWPVSATGWQAAALSAIAFVGLFVIVWSHEMGHILAARRYHIRTERIALSPLGGVAHLAAPARRPRDEALIALAGPAVHLVWLAIAWPLQLLLPTGLLMVDGWTWSPLDFTLWFLVTTNLSLLLFNLLPIWALDGGRVLRAALALRVHPNRATLWATTVGLVGGGVLVVMGLVRRDLSGAVPFVIGLSCLSASLQERRAARHMLVYEEAARQPWESDPEAWKRGEDPFAARDERPAVRPATIRPRKSVQKVELAGAQELATRLAQDEALDREVDRILARLHEVGMAGLDEQEVATLRRAAERRRGAG